MTMSDEEFNALVKKVGYGKAGEGDSYFTQEFLDEAKNTKLKPKTKANVGKRIIK